MITDSIFDELHQAGEPFVAQFKTSPNALRAGVFTLRLQMMPRDRQRAGTISECRRNKKILIRN